MNAKIYKLLDHISSRFGAVIRHKDQFLSSRHKFVEDGRDVWDQMVSLPNDAFRTIQLLYSNSQRYVRYQRIVDKPHHHSQTKRYRINPQTRLYRLNSLDPLATSYLEIAS